MKQLLKQRNVLKILLTLMLIIVISIAYYLTWIVFYNPYMRYSPLYSNGVILLILIYGILYILFSNVYNGFKIGHLRIMDIIYAQATTLLIVNSITYVEVSLMDRRLLHPGMFIVMSLLQFAMVVLWAYLSNRAFYRVFKPLKIVIFYKSIEPKNIIHKLKKRIDNFNVQTIMNVRDVDDSIIEAISNHEAVVLCDLETTLRNQILMVCYNQQIPVYLVPDVSDIIIGSSAWIHLLDTPLFFSENNYISLEQSILKRMNDIVLASCLLILTFPLFLLFSMIIKLSDGGAVFYKQDRITQHDRVFKIIKFRSMIMQAETMNQPQLACKHDVRITPFGRFMRKTRLDELPQLINILLGDMSFVGPRPERPELVERYVTAFPAFRYRTRVKAGLTGYAQIMGKYNTEIQDKLKLDLMYIENFSLLLDLKIIFATLKWIITPASEESSEGFDR